MVEFAKYGYGEYKNHHGGYPLWQIADNKKLLVEIYPYMSNPEREETSLIDNYIDLYGTAPLANTKVGKNSRYRYIRNKDIYVLK